MPFLYTSLVVFQEAKAIHREVCQLTKIFVSAYFHLKDQLNRAALSVALNIAEGSGKGSKREFRRYVMNAIGSVNELAAGLEIAFEENIINEDSYQNINGRLDRLRLRLGALSNKLT